MSEALAYQPTELTWLCQEIYRVTLQPIQTRLNYQAGQYVYLRLPNEEERPYSFASAPVASGQVEFHIRHVDSVPFMQEALIHWQQQMPVVLHGPFGHCHWQENDRVRVLVAGGTGIAPCKALLEALFAAPATTPPIPIYLYWSVSREDQLYLHALLQSWSKQYPYFHYTPVVSQTNTLLEVIRHNAAQLQQASVYAFGPPEMVMTLQRELSVLNIAQFYSDYG